MTTPEAIPHEDTSATLITRKVGKCKDCGADYAYSSCADLPASFHARYCNPCVEKQRAARERAEEIEVLTRRELKWKELCPPIMRETDQSRLPEEALKKVMAWAYGPKGMILHGGTGRGKTRAMWVLLRSQCDDGREIEAMTAAGFGRLSSDYAGSGESAQFARRLIRADILFIDDLGKGRMSDRNESDLFDIIDQRTAYKRPILITTNTVGEEFAKHLTPDRAIPLIRRLREFCDSIAF